MDGASPTDAATLTPEALADLATTTPERVAEMTAAGILTPDEAGRHPPGDLHRVRLIEAFGAAGVTIDALVAARRAGVVDFADYHRFHGEVGEPGRRYKELLADPTMDGDALRQILSALGLAEPGPATRLAVDDERHAHALAAIYAAIGEPDLILRLARLLGEGLRRAAEASLPVYEEAVHRAVARKAGEWTPAELEAFTAPWIEYARFLPELAGWLVHRHLTHAIDAWSVDRTEAMLAHHGYLPPRNERPPAIAFVDLAGYTRLSEERGDTAAATIALRLEELARHAAARHDGRIVKLLGDGVLLHARDAAAAVGASLDLLADLEAEGLPPGRAGVSAGPVVARDGDVFGRTVNLAARLVDAAPVGGLLATADAAAGLDPAAFEVEAAGEATFDGIEGPVAVVRIRRPSPAAPA